MSPNLLRPVFARTFRDYLNSMAPVKVKRLTRSIPGVPFVHNRMPFCNEGNRKAPNLERPFREHNSRGRLTARVEIQRAAKSPRLRLAMDCFCLAYRALCATTVEQIPLRSTKLWGTNTLSEALPLLSILSTVARLVADRKSRGRFEATC